MRKLAVLTMAAFLEVGGDALVRTGLRGGRIAGYVLGAAVLFAYGIVVNQPKWDFSRLMGVYIAVFVVVSQVIAVIAFHERVKLPVIVGGALVAAGGLVMTFWRVR